MSSALLGSPRPSDGARSVDRLSRLVQLEPRARSRLVLTLYGLALAAMLELAWTVLVSTPASKATDFLIVHQAVRRFLRGGPLYDVELMAEDFFGFNSHLPPFGLLLALPFAPLSKTVGAEVWRVVALLAHFAAVGLLLRTLGVPRWSPLAPLVLLVAALFTPARISLALAQWDAFFLLLLSAALWATLRQREVLAGALLALAGSVKPYPLLALGYFAFQRRLWTVLSALVSLGLLGGISLLVMGPRNSLTFVGEVVPHLSATTAYAENQSLAGFLARLLEPEMRPLVTREPLVYLGSRLLFTGLLVPLVLLSLRVPRTPHARALQLAAWVAAAPIGIPVAWMHYQELLLLPFVVLATGWALGSLPRPVRVEWLLFGLALLLVAAGDHALVLGPNANWLWNRTRAEAMNEALLARFAGPAMLLLSYKLYGALLLLALCLRAAWRGTAWDSSAAPWFGLAAGWRRASRSMVHSR